MLLKFELTQEIMEKSEAVDTRSTICFRETKAKLKKLSHAEEQTLAAVPFLVELAVRTKGLQLCPLRILPA
jgi:hypothetical protein